MANLTKEEKQYQSILDNLLDVSPTDTAVFTRVNNKYAFDFYSLFGPESFDYIATNKNFDIPVLEVTLLRVSQQLKDATTVDEVVKIYQENNYEISNNRMGMLKKQFEATKKKMIDELKSDFQRQSIKWKLFLNKANEINTESNIWPMHLGFLFVRLSIEDKSIYGPLFMKEVYMEVKNGRPYLTSNGDIKPNEKLMFLLKNAGFDLQINDNYGDWSIKELIKYLKEEWKDIYQFNLDIKQDFKKFSPEKVKNTSIEFEPGLVLGLFQPAGGYARNRMLEIIHNRELNKILDIEFNKNIYKNRVKETIFNPKTSIFKITPTNFSQDKAIASALNQNTIIWGPPGTGKSQTIVNILTNLLVYGKNSLVCSQKKAALEVIQNRMGVLKMFCLFMLNSKNMNKKSFYLPLREYLDYLENFEDKPELKPLRIINRQDIKFVENIATFAADERFKKMAQVISLIHETWSSYSQELWNMALGLPTDIKYPENFEFQDSKALTDSMLRLNKVYGKFLHPKNIKIKSIAKKMFNTFRYYHGNLNTTLEIMNSLKSEDYQYLNDLISILPSKNLAETSDEDQLKKFIAKSIIARIQKFTPDEKADYTEFAATIRLGSLEPYKFIKRFPNLIKKIFPIVIVTPEADLSSWKKEEFDYAIMDESSQIFIEKGLPVLYLAKIKILAGDDQQMQPSNWFGVRVTDDESIYGKVSSLLDFAKSMGVYNVLLDKNYRSNYASLMTFSSKYFYKSTLDVIDSSMKEKNFKPIEVYEVNGKWENNQNLTEAKLAIKLIRDNLNIYEKIILLCFNAKQQDAITTDIFKNHPDLEKAINNGNLLLRNIENIQGDEADLVIASVAYDKDASIHSTYVGRSGGKNALNVAISRAKDKMIVIKSLKAKDLNIMTGNEDALMFKHWLEFLELSEAQRQNFLNLDSDSASEKSAQIEVPSELNKEIKATLTEAIKNKPFLTINENETLGTLKVDYALKRGHQVLLCFVIDDYKYANNPEDFVTFRDLCKFIRSKKYTVYQLDRIIWEDKRQEILALIESYEALPESQVISSLEDVPTTQLLLKETKSDFFKDMKALENLALTRELEAAKIEEKQKATLNTSLNKVVDEDAETKDLIEADSPEALKATQESNSVIEVIEVDDSQETQVTQNNQEQEQNQSEIQNSALKEETLLTTAAEKDDNPAEAKIISAELIKDQEALPLIADAEDSLNQALETMSIDELEEQSRELNAIDTNNKALPRVSNLPAKSFEENTKEWSIVMTKELSLDDKQTPSSSTSI